MPMNEHGSLTKEFPLGRFDDLLLRIRPGMSIDDLRPFAQEADAVAVPGLLAKRYLLTGSNGQIVFDRILQEIQTSRTITPRLRKALFFLWCWRDDRLRGFIIDEVADKNGHWRGSVLMDKGRSAYFQKSHEPGPAVKARSNLEEHLVKSGILNRSTKGVDLSLSDGWLALAVEAAAQHEKDPAFASLLLRSPATALSEHGLYKLAGASLEAVAATLTHQPPLSNVREDEGISEPLPAPKVKKKVWKERTLSAGTGGTLLVIVDEVKRERASASHYRLERLLAERSTQAGFEACHDEHLDLYLTSNSHVLVAELKSCTELNLHAQVRRGVAQLFEYRFLYARDHAIPAANIQLLLVLELRPPDRKAWLVEYLRSVGITVAWAQDNKIVSTAMLSAAFKDLLILA